MFLHCFPHPPWPPFPARRGEIILKIAVFVRKAHKYCDFQCIPLTASTAVLLYSGFPHLLGYQVGGCSDQHEQAYLPGG